MERLQCREGLLALLSLSVGYLLGRLHARRQAPEQLELRIKRKGAEKAGAR